MLVSPCTYLKCLFTCVFHLLDCKIPEGRNYILCLASRRHTASGCRMNDWISLSWNLLIQMSTMRVWIQMMTLKMAKKWMDVKYREVEIKKSNRGIKDLMPPRFYFFTGFWNVINNWLLIFTVYNLVSF